MLRRNALLLAYCLITLFAARVPAADRPNVIILLTDDQGYGDLSCHGNPVLKTPNMDRLHEQSIRLTDFHVTPMCTPSRGELMSGRDALDNGAMNVSSGRSMLRQGIPTMADIFKAGGYRTGQFGKWHLGDVYPYRPQDRGFERSIWFPSSHIPSAPDHWNKDYFDTVYHNERGEFEKVPGYCTDGQFDQAMQWMQQQSGEQKPFFCYLALNNAHHPWWVENKYREPYRSLDKDLCSFFAMISNIDFNLGRLEAWLEQTKLRDNTILIFMTDNGGTVGVPFFNAGMKGRKVQLWEGGHRVPCFIRWPDGKLRDAGDVDELTVVTDMLPTLVDLCGLKSPADAKFDGTSLAKLLKGEEDKLADRMPVIQFSRMDHPSPEKYDSTVMWHKWRLLHGTDLYDVASDPTQDKNVAADHADVLGKMRQHYDAWWTDVEPTKDVLSRIVIGAEQQPMTLLSPADWQDLLLDQQAQVRTALPRNAPWNVEVATAGAYAFELRRWPREADLAMTARCAPFKAVDGEMPSGKALAIKKARLKIGEFDGTKDVSDSDKAIIFTVTLPKGDTRVQTWFDDAAGKTLCGAYYVYVERHEAKSGN